MAYQALDIAKYILNYCTKKRQQISNLKLQKILYFSWIDYYRATGKMLFLNEICAWQLGPVVPEVYYEYCSHAGMPITVKESVVIDNDDKVILDETIDEYVSVSARTLVDMTHQPNKPWYKIYKNGEGNRNVIPFLLIIRLECSGE